MRSDDGCAEPTNELLNRWVSFTLGDVYFPEPRELALSLHREEVIRGQVVDLSRGEGEQSFVVVRVHGFEPLLVVSARRATPEAPHGR
jgi:hypothetical protein